MAQEPSWSDVATDDAVRIGRRKRRGGLQDTEMDITPMIDITFLLLIFFVVASKMDPKASVELPPANFGVALPTKNAVIVTVARSSEGGSVAVYKGDGMVESNRVDASDLAELELELEQFVADAMLEDSRKRVVLIKAGGSVKHRDVARVTQAVSRVADVQGLHVAVLEE